MLTETEKAYLAGLLDGDGCITISGTKLPGRLSRAHCLIVSYAQKHRALLEYWQARVGMGSIYGPHKTRHSSEWVMSGQNAESFLRMVLPYLRMKRQEAEIGLKLRKTQHGRSSRHAVPAPILELREQYRQMMKDAKKNRGSGMELSPELQEYEAQLDSQIGLPGM